MAKEASLCFILHLVVGWLPRCFCRIPSRHAHDRAVRIAKLAPQCSLLDLLGAASDDPDAEDPQPAIFHYSLKARAMAVGIPIRLAATPLSTLIFSGLVGVIDDDHVETSLSDSSLRPSCSLIAAGPPLA